MGTVTLTGPDQLRLRVLEQWDKGSYLGPEAAALLHCSVRHARRLLAEFRRDGVACIPHGNRGRRPAHALDPADAQRATQLLTTEYAGYNNYHAQEWLDEHHELGFSVSTVRRLRQAAGLKSPRKRSPPKHRRRREPRPQAGMMLQLDGSSHRWFGPDGPEVCLLVAVDDATGETFARFEEQENCLGYMRLLQSIIARKGAPLSLYTDLHTIFRSPKQGRLSIDEQLAGVEPETQFSRACRELGIGIIMAHSPQAKGRVEKHNGTLQGRLVPEFDHEQVTDLTAAQRYLRDFLRRYNRRFMRPAAEAQIAYRPAPEADQVSGALCLKFERTVNHDHTVSLGNRRLELPRSSVSQARRKVEVRVDLQGRLSFWKEGQCLGAGPQLRGAHLATVQGLATLLPPTPAPGRPAASQPTAPARSEPTEPPAAVTPAADHPWRRFGYGRARRPHATIPPPPGG